MSSFDTVSWSTTSPLHVRTQRSPDSTLFRLPRQKGHDSDLTFLKPSINRARGRGERGHIPITIAVNTHGVATVWQNHFGAGLEAYPAFVFSLQISIAMLPLLLYVLGVADDDL
nr:hypothetical protein Iba_chr09cCG12890 [Ipomoea batatas]